MPRTFTHLQADSLPREHRSEHPAYEYYRRALAPYTPDAATSVYLYELPPGKSNFPYHYHTQGEEHFYILSGEGSLKTPSGNRPVKPGDYLGFPPGEGGAHKLTNTSATQPLVYLDFDSEPPLDAAIYPDSEKIGIFGAGLRHIFRLSEQTGYYDGE